MYEHTAAPAAPVIIQEQVPLADLDVVLDPGLREIAQYWLACREQDMRTPVWDMDFAMRFPQLVSRSMLFERRDDAVTVRLIGEECRKFIRLKECRGDLDTLFPRANADDMRHRIELGAETARPNYCRKSMSWNEGRDHIQYEALIMPFSTKRTTACSFFYGAMSFSTDEFRSVIGRERPASRFRITDDAQVYVSAG